MQQIIVTPSPNWYGAHVADWSPEAGLYAYGAQNTIVALNTRAQTVRTMLAGHSNRVTALAFAGAAAPAAAALAAAGEGGAEGLPPLMVSGAADRSLRLWNVAAMQRVRAVFKRPADVSALAASSDGTTALIGDRAGGLFTWDLASPASKPVKLGSCKGTAAVTGLAAAPAHSAAGIGGGLLLAGFADGSVLLVDWRQDRLLQRLERHSREVQCVRWAAAPSPAAAAAMAAAQKALAQAEAAAAACEAEAAAAAALGEEAAGSEEHGAQGATGEEAEAGAAEGGPEPAAQQTAAAAEGDEPPPPPPPEAPEPAEAASSAAAAAAAVAAARVELCAAAQRLLAAPPVWEVLLSSGADGSLRLYTFPDGLGGPAAALQPRPLAVLHVPKPHGGMTSSQSSRLWLSAAVVPAPPPAEPAPSSSSTAASAANGAAEQQEQQHVWLVSTSHGGGLLGWKVPLPSAAGAAAAAAAAEARAAAFGRRGPAQGAPAAPPMPAVTPAWLPVSHGRTVFTLHAASVAPVAPAAEPSGSPEQALAATVAAAPPQLQLLSTSMDRSLYMVQLPHPAAAVAAAAQEAAPAGSWRRDAAAGAAADAAWRQAAIVWRLTGLGGHVYSLSLLQPPAPAAPKAPQQLEAPPSAGTEEQQEEEEEEEEVAPPPPPPTEEQPAAAAVEGGEGGGVPPPPPAPGQEQEPSGAAAAPGANAPEQQQEQEEQQQEPEPEPMLLAVGCGDRSIRVQPLPAGAPQRAGSGAAQKAAAQLLLWQNVPGQVTAVAWQPMEPARQEASSTAAAAPDAPAAAGLAVAASAAATAVLAFGCDDGSLGLMLPSREQSSLLPVKHKGAIVDVCWARAAAPAGSDAAAGATLYSLSADGALLRWGPLPLPLSDLFTSRKGGSGGLAAAAASEASGGGGSWAAPGGKPSAAAAALASPADVRAQLAAAAAAKGGAVDAAAWLGILQDQPPPPITAFAMHAPPGEGPQGHLLAVAVQGGGVAVLSAVGPDAALLWASGGGGSGAPISHLAFSEDSWQLAAASEAGQVSIHPWAAEAGTYHREGGTRCERVTAAVGATIQLGSPVTALAWTGSSLRLPGSADGSSGGAPGCGEGGMLAAALLSGGIQLLDFEAEGPGGRLVPTALLRGHCGIVRALRWLPPLAPQPQPPPPRQLAAPQEGQQAAASPGQGEAQQAAAGEGQAERQEEGAEQAQQAAQPPRMLLLSGSEDQSVRLYDIQRQLAAWQQRQEAAAAAAQAAAEAERASAERAAQATEGAARPVEASAAAASLLATVGQPQEQRAAAADQAGVEAGTAIKRPAVTAEAAAPAPAAPLPSTVAPPAPAAAQPSAAELPGASKKKAVASALGSRPLLPTVAVGDSARQQQEAQMGCLSLVNQLLPAAAAAGSGGDVGGSAAAPPPDPAAVALLGCAADPLTASLALQQAAASLAAGAGSATSSAGRQATAQRGAAVALFRGDVAAAVQLLLEHDALAADFVSLSAAAGPAAWRAVTLAWAAKLEQQLGEPHMAALHLLAVREEEEAVRVYRRAGLLHEAVSLASARLLPGHPLLQELRAAYAAQLSGKGQHEQAAAQLAAAGQWAAAAAALCARRTAAGSAVAVHMCRLALSRRPTGMSAEEESKVQEQLAAAEQLLSARAEAEGTDAAAVLAAALPPPAAPQQQEPAAAGGDAAAPAAGGRAQRQRYSPAQLMAVPAAQGAPRGLPQDLAAGGPPQSSAGLAAAPALAGDAAVFGRSGASRTRYSLQALLEVSEAAQAAGGAGLRGQLPPELVQPLVE